MPTGMSLYPIDIKDYYKALVSTRTNHGRK